jgi:hypothetical protein
VLLQLICITNTTHSARFLLESSREKLLSIAGLQDGDVLLQLICIHRHTTHSGEVSRNKQRKTHS